MDLQREENCGLLLVSGAKKHSYRKKAALLYFQGSPVHVKVQGPQLSEGRLQSRQQLQSLDHVLYSKPSMQYLLRPLYT